MGVSRRTFLKSASLGVLSLALGGFSNAASDATVLSVLDEFGYGDVYFERGLARTQFEATLSTLMELSEDSILKPFRERAGMAAPGEDLGGWYDNYAGFDWEHGVERGFAPGHCFGQWVSALARAYAVTGENAVREKMRRLIRAYARTIGGRLYEDFRFPAYTYDKLTCALIDAHQFAGDKTAFALLDRTTDAAEPFLPARALDHDEMRQLPHKNESYCWDESYTLPENLFLAYGRGAGDRYRTLAVKYLKDDTYFDPLSKGQNVLPGRHAYSYMNALSSAMQAYLVLGSEKHLRAATNAFDIIHDTQSFATGGWGPDETFREPGRGDLGRSLTDTHRSFETPCGAYAHFKLTRYLLRVTRDARYGDSMERVFYNTVLGARPLQADGRTYYYSDYNFNGSKTYHKSKFPCCAGTLPQIAADYRISTYFRDEAGIYVNLYIPSTLRFRHRGAMISLSQASHYPHDGHVQLKVACHGDCELALRLRIPAYAGSGATLAVNGRDAGVSTEGGTFAEIRRTWRDGDRVDLVLPLPLRLQKVDPQHPDVVALLRGPLVLFPTAPTPSPVRRQELLSATASAGCAREWRAKTASGPLRLMPFTDIVDERYTTYLRVT